MSTSLSIAGRTFGGDFSQVGSLPKACGHRVLYFHLIGRGDFPIYEGGIPAERFEALLINLRNKGFAFISIQEALESKTSLKGTISLCSDDGFASNYSVTLPILKVLRIPFTLFINGCSIDNSRMAWNHSLAYLRTRISEPALRAMLPGLVSRFGLTETGDPDSTLFTVGYQRRDEMIDWLWEHFELPDQKKLLNENKPFLSVEQLRNLTSGQADIALHGNTHADFSRLSYSEIRDEIVNNIKALEDVKLQWKPWLAFPYGRQCSTWNMDKLSRELGIERFFGIRCRWNDNRPGELLWQRCSIEMESFNPWRELMLKPLYRELRSH